jgi:uncharacterized membrane protein YheB (UPF0754 family)
MLNKNMTPNLIAALIVVASFLVAEPFHSILLSVGLFALSGAVTNWLAVHMLFERVPGLYGSGVIPLHFEEFKKALHKLATEELFKIENVENALQSATDSDHTTLDVTPALEALDLDVAFERLVAVIMESSLGGMLGMVGGAPALEPMKEPFKDQIGEFLVETTQSEKFQNALHSQISQVTTSDAFIEKVDQIIIARLDELTPEMVKDIIKRMIKEHLGWLVVWGGVFGGVIGLVTALVF